MATKKTEHETLGMDPEDALELGTPEPNQLATATEYHSFEGETDASDIQIPYLKLWQASCDEAKFFLRNCPDTKMDGDHDGIPCEEQWCTSGF